MGLSQTCPWSLPTAPPPGWELKTPTWSSIFRCSWTTLFSMPTLRRFRCSAERASILRAFSSRLALSLRKPHWMTMAAPRSRWKHLRASQLRTCFWMMVALCSLRTWQGTSTHLWVCTAGREEGAHVLLWGESQGQRETASLWLRALVAIYFMNNL